MCYNDQEGQALALLQDSQWEDLVLVCLVIEEKLSVAVRMLIYIMLNFKGAMDTLALDNTRVRDGISVWIWS